MNIFLSNNVIMLMSVIAVIITVAARFVKHDRVGEGLAIAGFLLVLASITYALLLGAELSHVLIYILVFSLIGAVVFLPAVTKSKENINAENRTDTEDTATHRLKKDDNVEACTDSKETGDKNEF